MREAIEKRPGNCVGLKSRLKTERWEYQGGELLPLPSFGSGRPPLESKAIFLSNSFTLSTFSQHRLTINVHSYVRSFKACRRSTFQTLKEDLTWKTTAQNHAFWWSPSAVLWVSFHAKKHPLEFDMLFLCHVWRLWYTENMFRHEPPNVERRNCKSENVHQNGYRSFLRRVWLALSLLCATFGAFLQVFFAEQGVLLIFRSVGTSNKSKY